MNRFIFFLCLGLSLAISFPAQATPCPNLAIVLDHSGSMGDAPETNQLPMSGMQSKFQIAVNNLDPILRNFYKALPIGFVMFPSASADCNVAAGFDIPPAYDAAPRILNSLYTCLNSSFCSPFGSTPICQAVNAIRQTPEMKDPKYSQYVLLITDGTPAGCPTCADGTATALDSAVKAIADARAQTPSIKTYVVGFGSLSADDKTKLNALADAGGVPNGDPNQRFYPADNSDTLLAVLNRILNEVTSGDAGGGMSCDSSCYTIPCANPGDVCVSGDCKPNPCQGVSCPAGQYCYTDGMSAGQCVSECKQVCPAGNRCIRGQCQPSKCITACDTGKYCEAATHQCQLDPACKNVTCKPTQGCFGGVCKDDPCTFVTCPAGDICIPFEGSCAPIDYAANLCKYVTCEEHTRCDATLSACVSDGSVGSGCACELSDSRSRTSALFAPALLLFSLMVLRRRMKRGALS